MSTNESTGHSDETLIPESSLQIDCDYCEHLDSETCGDCLVTYLCRPDRNSVVIELSEIRALRTLSQGGLVPELKLRKPAGSTSGR
ncbi:MAG: hypothetical protein CL460_00650 [Acidimicrobiaceae bacterium]|nr:hypothetical protein [Acidimicrobiaceae bacterium]